MADDKEKTTNREAMDVDDLLAERERLDKLFKDKFQRIITVMFTDLKGSTAIADTQGDLAHRSIIKQHNDIVFPIIKKHQGILVKTMGDGTMSYFDKPQDSLRAAVDIQKSIDQFNLEKKSNIPILIRAGIHTGLGIIEENDIFGDVVNVASRFEGQASAGEICISEETYNALEDKSEVYCRFIKETTVKGKKEPVKLYKAFWNPKEIEADIAQTSASSKASSKAEETKGLPRNLRIAIYLAIPTLIVLSIILFQYFFTDSGTDEKRSRQHSISQPAPKEDLSYLIRIR